MGAENKKKSDQEVPEGIQEIDRQILSLIKKRQNIAGSAGRENIERDFRDPDPVGDKKYLDHLEMEYGDQLPHAAIKNIFTEIISAERSIQKLHAIAFLGPEATFTHQAAISIYGKSAELIAAENIEEVFGLVEKGTCFQGIVPIENSYEGFVNRTVDLFYEYPLKIIMESYCKIEHHLFSLSGFPDEIDQLYSHPMAYAQCRLWLNSNLPGVPFSQVPSTAYGALKASNDRKAAAICCKMAGENYGLKCLQANIEDVPGNYTRFFVIGKETNSIATGDDKTSILFLLNHVPGALHRALGAIAEKGINLNHIHSRPLKSRSWEYLFVVDMTGHEYDRAVKEALEEMKKYCVFIKHLGSYPAGSQSWRL